MVDQYNFRGIIFDRRLSFIPHINYLKTKCNKVQWCNATTQTCSAQGLGGGWQTNRNKIIWITGQIKMGLWLYQLWYCFIYCTARKSYLKVLDTIHHQELRLILGAFKTFPSWRLMCCSSWNSTDIKTTKNITSVLYQITIMPKTSRHQAELSIHNINLYSTGW